MEDEPPQEALEIVWWCQQAYDRGLLQGDLNQAQSLARHIVFKLEMLKERNVREGRHDYVEGLVDLWMALEHGEAYAEKERRKNEEELNQSNNQVDLLSPDMAGMLDMLHRMAEVESAKDGE